MSPQSEGKRAPNGALAHCHGFEVMAEDGPAGIVETPLFPPDADAPDYLIIRTGRRRTRFPIVSVALVRRVDPSRAQVHLAVPRRTLAALPERLPITFH